MLSRHTTEPASRRLSGITIVTLACLVAFSATKGVAFADAAAQGMRRNFSVDAVTTALRTAQSEARHHQQPVQFAMVTDHGNASLNTPARAGHRWVINMVSRRSGRADLEITSGALALSFNTHVEDRGPSAGVIFDASGRPAGGARQFVVRSPEGDTTVAVAANGTIVACPSSSPGSAGSCRIEL